MMSDQTNERVNSVEELRRAALELVQSEKFEEALSLYDEAILIADSDEQRELITINKADAMIALGRPGPEVQALPRILMARRNAHHTFVAAYALMYKHRLSNETKRAIFYGNIALDAANEADQAFWKIAALNDLGIVYEIDSQFASAIESFEAALALIDGLDDDSQQSFSKVAIFGNLGYSRLLVGETQRGIEMLESILDKIQAPTALSDACVELCYGYIDLGEFATARAYGERGLELACDERQIRNAHYLLGEAAYKLGDIEAAEIHFEELARFYPQFRHLKSVLFAIDLRSMINLRL